MMIRFALKVLLGLGLLWVALLSAQGFAAVDYLAYGDLRGHIEPCGCDPSTDLGGIRRLAVVMARERRLRPDLVAFDLGNDLPLAGEPQLKTPFLLSASARLKPGAVLLNQLELERLSEIEAHRQRGASEQPPYVLSNYLPARARPNVAKEMLQGKGWVALGYTYTPQLKERLQQVGPALIKSWQTLLAYVPVGQRVLLFSGSGEDLQTILQAKLFDVIISSNTSPLATIVGSEERERPERLIRVKTPQVAMVPLGGQGLLRGGALQFAEAKPLGDYLKEPAPKQEAWLQSATLVTWLTPEAGEAEGPFMGLYEEYTRATKEAFRGQSAQRLREFKETPFAGAEACASCHPAAAKVYAGSKHAQAMATLAAKGKQEDGECVACHAVGAAAKGGFVSVKDTPQLANVQCENCHGPRLAHTKNPVGMKQAAGEAKGVCVGCHNQQHSPKFNFEGYWGRIVHGGKG